MTSAWEWIQSTSCTAAPLLGIGGFLFPPLEVGAAVAGGVCAVSSLFGDEETGDEEL